MSARRTTSEGASRVGRRSCTGVEFVVVAGAGVAEAGTDVVGVVVDDEVTVFEGVSCLPTAEVGCVGPESLRWFRGRDEPSMKGVSNLRGREAGLWTAERSLAISCVSWSWSPSLYRTSLS